MIKFGTGGWRDIIGDGFTKNNIQKLSMALAMKIRHENVADEGIVMGYDRRFLSKEAMHWAAEVFAALHIRVFIINHSEPTPLVMFYVEKHQLHYGLMVTASHNPAIYNGIKVFTYGGRDADEQQTKEIEKYIAGIEDDLAAGSMDSVPSMDYDQGVKAGWIVDIRPRNEYLDSILNAIDTEAIRRRNLRIVLDPMYGVSETSLKTILLTTRCEIETIHDRHDTLFGGKLPAPNHDTLKSLQHYVTDKNYDLGIATDGDADRIGIIDDKGRFLHPNDILVVLYYYLVKYRGWKGPVVRNIATTHRLDRIAQKFGERCYEVPVGFKYISAKMDEKDAILGGESSGGLTVRGHIHGKDGIYASALLVEMLAVTGKKMSEMMDVIHDEFGYVHMEERDYKFSDERKKEIYHKLFVERKLPEFPYSIERISDLDGCKVYFKNGGWVIARFSGTEPLLRIFCEMKNPEDAGIICRIFEKHLNLR